MYTATESMEWFKYLVLFVDDFSRTSFLYLMKSKSEVPTIFKDFHMHVKTQFRSNIKVLRSDNGSEFMSNNMLEYISSQGIIHQTSCVGTPQQNGVAERKIDLTHLKVFGWVCFIHIQTLNHDKLDATATKCVFMGYSATQKRYKCFNPIIKKCTISRDVKFEKHCPYFTSQGEDLVDMFPLPQNFNHSMLEERSITVSPACEEVQIDQITTSEREEEPYSDHSPSSSESQVIKRNPP